MPYTHNTASVEQPPNELPSGALLHYSILLTGFGTVFLGPLLPTLTAAMHATDRGGGAMLAAQFSGAFVGGWTTGSPLWRCMLRGYLAATVGFAALGWLTHATGLSRGLPWLLPALAVLGFGIGQMITSVNLLASQRWASSRGAALTLLNFTWSLGALTAPLLLLRLLQSLTTGTILTGMAALLLAGLLVAWSRRPRSSAADAAIRGTETASGELPRIGDSASDSGISSPLYLYFCLLLFLYGGIETSLSGWLTTFDARYGTGHLTIALSTSAFWFSLTATRALAPLALRVLRERTLLRLGLAGAIAAFLLMLVVSGAPAIAACAALAGISLAPWFPLVLSQLVGLGPTARQAGRVIAVSGLGAAALPWMVGQLSATTGSLRSALLLPALGVAALLFLSFRRQIST